LLALPERGSSGYREYSNADEWRLDFIARARRPGFTLGEIGELLGPTEAQSTGGIVREVMAWPDAVDQQLTELACCGVGCAAVLHVCEYGSDDDCVTLRLAWRSWKAKGRKCLATGRFRCRRGCMMDAPHTRSLHRLASPEPGDCLPEAFVQPYRGGAGEQPV
jgi:hypothetical protein